jgi:hypothetical protein
MSYNLLHLLSTNHKCTHACFIKTDATQNKIIVQSSLKISKSTKHMSPSHLSVKLKSAASYKRLFIRLRLSIIYIKYYDTLFRYDIVRVYTCIVYHMCERNLILTHI